MAVRLEDYLGSMKAAGYQSLVSSAGGDAMQGGCYTPDGRKD